jgi:DNA-binding response OmpR family regulator
LAAQTGTEEKTMQNFKYRIMVVEDDLPLLYSISFTLKRHEYLVSMTITGREALMKLLAAQKESDPYHLLVIDMVLPGITSLELIEQMALRHLRLPVLAVTANTDRTLLALLMQRGIDEILLKPFTTDELVKRTFSILNNQHQI